MKELPYSDRPYEKCLASGPESLTDAELLSVILRTGARGESSLELSKQILELSYPAGILGLLHLSLPELMAVRGIGKVKGIELLCIGELSRRIWRTLVTEEAVVFNEPAVISGFYMQDMRHMEQEELHLMMLNTKNVLIKDSLIFRGTVNMSVASPREMFIEALRYHAVHIILVHNHPSGDPSPSKKRGLFLVSGYWIILLSGIILISVLKNGELYSYEEQQIYPGRAVCFLCPADCRNIH